MEVISALILAVVGWLVYNKIIDSKLDVSEKEENKILEFKQNESVVAVDQLKKTLAEQKTGQEMTPEEVESYWNKDKK